MNTDTATVDATVDTAAPNAETPVVETPAPEVEAGGDAPADPDAAAIAAFDKGVAEAAAAEPAPPAASTAEDAEKPAAEAPAAATPNAEAAKSDAPVDPAKAAAAKQDEAVEKEITELGLKEKTAERFRELSKRPSEADIAPLREKAERAEQWEQIIATTAATPTQLNSALGYLQAINSGDPAQMRPAFEAMKKEVAWLGERLGLEVPGLVDPLAAHKDLAAELDNGQISRERALEIVAQRTEAARRGELAQQNEQRQRSESEFNAAAQRAIGDIGVLNDRLKAADPDFARKLPLLKPALDIIKSSLPPQQWAAAIQNAYAGLPSLPAAAAAPPPPVSAMPLRPTGSSAVQQRKPRNDVEAFEMGVASVR